MTLSTWGLKIADEPPASESITAYDRQHLAIYLSLLYAAGEGHSEEKIARDVLGMDAMGEPDRVQRVVGSHLRRARWLAESGNVFKLAPGAAAGIRAMPGPGSSAVKTVGTSVTKALKPVGSSIGSAVTRIGKLIGQDRSSSGMMWRAVVGGSPLGTSILGVAAAE